MSVVPATTVSLRSPLAARAWLMSYSSRESKRDSDGVDEALARVASGPEVNAMTVQTPMTTSGERDETERDNTAASCSAEPVPSHVALVSAQSSQTDASGFRAGNAPWKHPGKSPSGRKEHCLHDCSKPAHP